MTTSQGAALPGKSALGLIAGAALAWPSTAALAQDNYVYLGTSMFGEYQIGQEGAGEDASGDFSAELNLDTGMMCYMLEVDGLGEVVSAHIHKGDKDSNGPPVVTLELLGEDGDDVCVTLDKALLADIAKNRANYYVNVHTMAFPLGAVRGQLGR